MQLRRYCVTVMDNWHLTRYFWTLRCAVRHRNKFPGYGFLWIWDGREWQADGYMSKEQIAQEKTLIN